MNLPDLIAKVEGLRGPNREVDFWLTVRVFAPCDYTDAELQADIDLVGIEGMAIEAPYTASIDAAVALVEKVLPGWMWGLTQGSPAEDDGREFQGNIWPGEQPFPSDMEVFAYHPVPALALILALLRALERNNG